MLSFLVRAHRRRPYLVCFIPTLLFYIIIFGQRWIPTFDSFAVLVWMHHYLSAFAFSGDFGLWAPYMGWGKTVHSFLLGVAHPTLFFLSPVVKLNTSLNLIPLYYFTFLLDEIIFGLGVYALATQLFKTSVTRYFVVLSLTGCVLWTVQPSFNFHSYYLLPLCFFLILRACKTESCTPILWGLNVVVWGATFGVGLYMGIIQSLAFLLFLAGALWAFELNPRRLLKTWGWKQSALVILLLAMAAITLLFVTHGGAPAIITPGRDSSGRVTYDMFLEYGYDAGFQYFNGILHGLINWNDVTVYGGILMLPFALLGLVFSRDRKQIPWLVLSVVLFLFYLGKNSFVAPLFYYVPGFSLYRHIGFITPILKLSFLFLAGFGFESFVLSLKEGTRKERRLFIFSYLALFLMAVILVIANWRAPIGPAFVSVCLWYGVAIALGLALLSDGPQLRKSAALLLVILAMVDVYSYRTRMFHEQLIPVSQEGWDLFRVRKPQYVPRTQDYFQSERFSIFTKERFSSIKPFSFWEGSFYSIMEEFLHIDPCQSAYRNDTALPYVGDITRRFDLNRFKPLPKRSLAPFPELSNLRFAVGCEVPKIQLYRSVRLLPSDQDVLASLEKSEGGGLVASVAAGQAYANGQKLNEGQSGEPILAPIQVSDFSPGRFSFEVDGTAERTRSKLWLYYADAWHTQWKAFVNGVEVPILRANHAFKAIEIPTGKSTVKFIYSSFKETALLVLLWLEAVGGLILFFAVMLKLDFRRLT